LPITLFDLSSASSFVSEPSASLSDRHGRERKSRCVNVGGIAVYPGNVGYKKADEMFDKTQGIHPWQLIAQERRNRGYDENAKIRDIPGSLQNPKSLV
jgi:hypothetical protein